MKNPTGEKPKTFKEAFAAARKKLGPGKVFTFKGKKYTTDLASEKKKSKSTKKKSTVKTISSKVKSCSSRYRFSILRNCWWCCCEQLFEKIY